MAKAAAALEWAAQYAEDRIDGANPNWDDACDAIARGIRAYAALHAGAEGVEGCQICHNTGWVISNITNAECRKEHMKVSARVRCPNGCAP